MCNMSTQPPPSEIQAFGLNAGSPFELSLGSGEMAAFPDHVNIMSIFNAVPPEGPKITGIHYLYLALSLAHRDFF